MLFALLLTLAFAPDYTDLTQDQIMLIELGLQPWDQREEQVGQTDVENSVAEVPSIPGRFYPAPDPYATIRNAIFTIKTAMEFDKRCGRKVCCETEQVDNGLHVPTGDDYDFGRRRLPQVRCTKWCCEGLITERKPSQTIAFKRVGVDGGDCGNGYMGVCSPVDSLSQCGEKCNRNAGCAAITYTDKADSKNDCGAGGGKPACWLHNEIPTSLGGDKFRYCFVKVLTDNVGEEAQVGSLEDLGMVEKTNKLQQVNRALKKALKSLAI